MQKTILVVDDESDCRLMLTHVLSKQNYRVITAIDGADGLEAYKREPVDLILADMKMPKMDGLDLVAAVKRISPDARIVLITGYAMESRVQKALELKAAACLYKPFDVPVLLSTIGSLLGEPNF